MKYWYMKHIYNWGNGEVYNVQHMKKGISVDPAYSATKDYKYLREWL